MKPWRRENEVSGIERWIQAMMGLFQSPELMNLMFRQQAGEKIDQAELFKLVMSNPKVAQPFIQAIVKSGEVSFSRNRPTGIDNHKAKKRGRRK